MGSSYAMTVVFHALHPRDAAAAWDTLVAYGLVQDSDPTSGQRYAPRVRLGRVYCHDSTDWEDPLRFTRELAEEAPSALVEAAIDGDDEEGTTGNMALLVPGRDVYTASCDGSGPIYTRDEVLVGIERGELDVLLGTVEFQAVRDAAATHGPRVIAAELCPGCGDPGRCETSCPVGLPGCELPACVSHTECELAAREEDQAWDVNEVMDRITLAPGEEIRTVRTDVGVVRITR